MADREKKYKNILLHGCFEQNLSDLLRSTWRYISWLVLEKSRLSFRERFTKIIYFTSFFEESYNL
ncbi:hypothetical protein V1478_014257 [Vespula squamosa]|uniref:Uncharacterized protein n=1 Tax=Vespula squamosa TaxID=30214 RepID=A0ABD2A7K2_VESSQ